MTLADEAFEQADITPAELRDNPDLLERLIETGMRIGGPEADPHMLMIALQEKAHRAG